MLREVKGARQIPGDPFRRWFSGDQVDLIVWYDDDSHNTIIGFQLCYMRGDEEKALTWYDGKGYTHSAVDNGEGRPGRYKMSPILVRDGVFHGGQVLELFEGISKDIDPDIVGLVSRKIREYPEIAE